MSEVTGWWWEFSDALAALDVGVCEVNPDGRIARASPTARTLLELVNGSSARLTDLIRGGAHSVPLRVVEVSSGRFLLGREGQPAPNDRLELLAAALGAAANGVVITDGAGVIVYANPAIGRITGYACEELVGRHTRVFKSGQQPREVYQAMWTTILGGATWSGTLVNRRKDGSTYFEELSITPIPAAQGVHFVAVKRDVTAQRRLEEVVSRNERLDLVGQLATSVAHDLANILTPISTSAAYLVRLRFEDQVAREAVDDLSAAAEQAGQLVRQLLDFVRGGRGLQTPIDTSRILDMYARQLARLMPMAVQLEADVPPGLPHLVVDGMQLYQVLLNLCVNAADAMPRGGRVWLTAAAAGNGVHVEVRDTGVGIPPSARTRLFEPFFSTKPPGRGTGIGLATVKRIVEAHGGTISFASEVGAGTTFRVVFPGASP